MTAFLARLRSFIRAMLSRERLESEMEAEIRFHLESRTEDLLRGGLSPQQASRQAQLEFGGVASHKDSMRASFGLRWFDDIWTDLVYGARILRKSPCFTAIAVASLALAIGANTTIFSYGNEVLFGRLGVPHAEQLRAFRLTGDDHMAVREMWGNDAYREDDKFHIGIFPNPSYQLLRRQNHSVEDIFAFKELPDIAITATGTPELGKVELVSPIGKRFRSSFVGPDASRWIEIVGVCADTRYFDMREPAPPIHFDLDLQHPTVGGVTFIIRSALKADALIPSFRRAAQNIDPDLPLSNVRTQQQQIDASMQQERMFASFTAGFGILALVLACVGIYGIMAYTVSLRTNEIGIRLALGAARAQIQAIVLREVGWLAISGVIIGLLVTLALIRLVKSMLYGLTSKDPITLAGSALLLLLIAFFAGWAPAHRASRVDPAEALRHD